MHKPKILIVEDELIIAKDISNVLENEGYDTIIGITTVKDAILQIENNELSLVLIDINLSDNSDGVELGNYLLKKEGIPYIYITSYSDNVTLDRVKDTRPNGIIIKPFKNSDIKSTVSIVLNNFKQNALLSKKLKSSDNVEKKDDTEEVPFMLKKVIEFINENIDERINIQELTALTQWSQHHFIKNFAKYLKSTPYQYILKKKIEKAKILITTSDLPISSVAFTLGFSSYSNFHNAFKRETGNNPLYFRQFKKEMNT